MNAGSPWNPGKVSNLLKVLASYVSDLDLIIDPVQIDIEPTTRCNLQCTMCPNSTLTRESGSMDPALFRAIVDQTIGTTLEYHLDMFGEPLLHHDIAEMLSYLVRRGGRVVLYTNLARRNDDLVRFLARSGVNRVIVNLSATDARTYSAVHGTDRFETVLRNLDLLRTTRDGSGARRPLVIVSYLVMKANLHERSRAREWLRPHCDDVRVAFIHDWLGTPGISDLVPGDRPPAFRMKCSRPWTSASILWDGRVATCCYDHAGTNVLGDLRSSDLHDIWNSPTVRGFRKRYREMPPCRTCEDEDHQFLPSNVLFLLRNLFTGRD